MLGINCQLIWPAGWLAATAKIPGLSPTRVWARMPLIAPLSPSTPGGFVWPGASLPAGAGDGRLNGWLAEDGGTTEDEGWRGHRYHVRSRQARQGRQRIAPTAASSGHCPFSLSFYPFHPSSSCTTIVNRVGADATPRLSFRFASGTLQATRK